MDHFSEVLKILDAALRHNPRQAVDYAGLLAEKLEGDGQSAQARLLRQRLGKVPEQMVAGQLVDSGAPRDKESRLGMLDESAPAAAEDAPILSPIVQKRLAEFIVAVERYDDLAAEGVALPSRLLLYGPPGCGKTLIARWAAATLQRPLLTVRCDTLVSSLLGQTSRHLRQVFEHAESRECVLFLDEFDALGKARSDEREVGELQRVVISLLQNLDAMSPQTVLVAATNHEELLDRAVWRRFGFSIRVDLPDAVQRAALWRSKLGRFALTEKDTTFLVEFSDGMSAAAIETAAFDSVRDAVLTGQPSISLAGAMRRAARMIWLASRAVPSCENEELRWLRKWAPSVFTYRALGNLFKRNLRQIRNALEEEHELTGQSNSAGGVGSS